MCIYRLVPAKLLRIVKHRKATPKLWHTLRVRHSFGEIVREVAVFGEYQDSLALAFDQNYELLVYSV